MENDAGNNIKEIFNLVKLIIVLLFILDTILLYYHYNRAIKSSMPLDCYNSCLQLFVGDTSLAGMIHRESKHADTCECLTISRAPKVSALEEETHVSYSRVAKYARK